MSFYILANQVTFLLLSLNLMTTLSFDSEIISYMYGGSKEEIYFKVTNKNKTLAIKPLMKSDYSNLLVITKSNKYYFNLKYSETKPHQFIEVFDGVKSHNLSKKLHTTDYEILEGKSSVLIINKKSEPLFVNSKEINRKEYFSKGVPIFINNERVLN
ncbi:MAG: hypothetical protein CME62_14995 [Halobacteriovoraceae bacterium]|nr:hypothetical protein [Halobacteriovoraceae bacterium]|tara:strand:- start:3086 stop:3556 length:471 start_codon:yes stop_codon:yes gene_type:complete